ncbi:transposase family protein [Streptomyces sp. RY43-2]|uniref:Transposase family protein n=1 Tax=Streptomyces macrolidinus TaxID=2952607 RepID=A0ABT0ZHK2_9ACTN|nr:transposase family protein [Streptomyces macrolidinus]MCN9243072.1 transposase family protein [Streptomyces macrolidinus]
MGNKYSKRYTEEFKRDAIALVKKNAPDWYEETHERQRKAHSSRRIRVEHGIAHLKNWRALVRHLGRREHMSDIVQAVAGLLSHQQTADLTSARQV